MSATVTIEFPEDVLIAALRRLSPARRHELIFKVETDVMLMPRGVPAVELDKWVGLINVGGDALEDSERLYDD